MSSSNRGRSSARLAWHLGKNGGGHNHSFMGQTRTTERIATSAALGDQPVAEVVRGAWAVDLSRVAVGIVMLLGAAVSQATFCYTRLVHLALRDPHGDLGNGVLVTTGVPKAHRRPWAGEPARLGPSRLWGKRMEGYSLCTGVCQ